MRYILFLGIIVCLTYFFVFENPFLDGSNRPNITFIVGEDTEEDNHYFSAAKKYYAIHDTGNQTLIVDTCRSLVSVQTFLKNQKTPNNKAWGKINIVAHGNEWTGLKMSIAPNQKGRVNTVTLKTAIDNNMLPNFSWSRKIDRLTELHIQGCGVGKDEDLLNMMKKAFGGRLQVYSPEKFVVYQPDNQCYLADFYYSFHHPDSLFSAEKSTRDLTQRYPSVQLNWASILQAPQTRNAQNPFVYRFKIPIRWTVNFADSTEVPKFPNPSGLQFEDWLLQQKNLMSTLDKTHLPPQAFRWVFDTEGASMKIYGVCQVVCILKPSEIAVL
ncbi:MAG: hypothetical protein JNL70_05040 [Saprospiraceae bacterium]|nr:hypothetical protein [Saprospiraceae bacterium]